MADTPASSDSRSTILENTILSEEPAQKSSSDVDSDGAPRHKRVGFAPLPPRRAASMPTPPILRSSRYTLLRGGRPRAQRGGSLNDGSIPNVQAVIEAYETGKITGNNAAKSSEGKVSNTEDASIDPRNSSTDDNLETPPPLTADKLLVEENEWEADGRRIKAGKTWIPKWFVRPEAIVDCGYQFGETTDFYLIQVALSQDEIDKVKRLSDQYKYESNDFTPLRRAQRSRTSSIASTGQRTASFDSYTAPSVEDYATSTSESWSEVSDSRASSVSFDARTGSPLPRRSRNAASDNSTNYVIVEGRAPFSRHARAENRNAARPLKVPRRRQSSGPSRRQADFLGDHEWDYFTSNRRRRRPSPHRVMSPDWTSNGYTEDASWRSPPAPYPRNRNTPDRRGSVDLQSRSSSRGRTRLGDRFGNSLEGDTTWHRQPSPTIHVYNGTADDFDYVPHPQYPQYPPSRRASPRTSPDGRSDRDRTRLGDELAELSLGRDRNSQRHGRAAPIINIYNRLDQESGPQPSYVPYPSPPQARSRSRTSPSHHEDYTEQQLALVPVSTSRSDRRQNEAVALADEERKAIEAQLALEVRQEEAQKEIEAADRLTISTEYDFDLPAKYSVPGSETGVPQERTPGPSVQVPTKTIPNVRIMLITHSRWGLTSAGGITASLENHISNAAPSGLVWAHIHKPANSFSDFLAVVSSLPSLANDVRSQITAFLEDIRSKHELQKHNGLELSPKCLFCSPQYGPRSMPLYFAACEEVQTRKLQGPAIAAQNVHPIRPLMEVLKPGADNAREKKQVLSRVTGKDIRCIAISQTWLLLIGDSCLITASARSEDDFLPHEPLQKVIAQAVTPPPASSSVHHTGKVRLSYTGRSWEIAASDCQSWPALWASFLEAFAERAHGLRIVHGSQTLNSRTWSLLQKQDRGSVLELSIVKDESRRVPSASQALRQEVDKYMYARSDRHDPPPRTDSKDSDGSTPSTVTLEPLLGIFQFAKSTNASTGAMETADELHKILDQRSVPIVGKTYRDCSTESLKNLNALLTEQNNSRDRYGRTSDRIELVVTLKHLSSFFWPSETYHEMLSKFRNMLCTILEAGMDSTKDVYFMYDWRSANDLLRRALATAIWISTTFSEDSEAFPPPSADFVKAWLHLHTAVTLLSLPLQPFDPQSSVHEAAVRHLELLAVSLESADEALVRQLRTADIKQHECTQVNGIFWLALSRLTSQAPGANGEISDVYRQYLTKLDPEITNHPTDRNLQERLRMFREEVEGLRDILDRNFSTIAKARDAKGMGVVDAGQARPPLGGDDPRLKLSRDTLLRLRRRRDRFNELAEMAAVLQSRTEREVGEVKNDQEKAIYLFTIVTVIFLPLSFVSSLFGMNTNDIRNLNSNQWLFWVVAIPVTVLTIGACLWFAGGIRLGLGWPTTSERWKRTSDSAISPPSYQDAINSPAYYLAEKDQRQPDRNIDAFAAGDQFRSPPVALRHAPRSGLEYYSPPADHQDRSYPTRRPLARRRSGHEY